MPRLSADRRDQVDGSFRNEQARLDELRRRLAAPWQPRTNLLPLLPELLDEAEAESAELSQPDVESPPAPAVTVEPAGPVSAPIPVSTPASPPMAVPSAVPMSTVPVSVPAFGPAPTDDGSMTVLVPPTRREEASTQLVADTTPERLLPGQLVPEEFVPEVPLSPVILNRPRSTEPTSPAPFSAPPLPTDADQRTVVVRDGSSGWQPPATDQPA